VAWSKLLGNAFAGVFCVLRYPDNHFLLSLCAITFVLDLLYLPLMRHRFTADARLTKRAA
jgi:hypothetical protein